MGLVLSTITWGINRHTTAPAPPQPIPGIIPNVDKRYGSPIPLVLGRGVVSGQLVYQSNLSNGSGPVWDGIAWATRSGLLGVDVVVALCEAPVGSVVRSYRQWGTSLVVIAAADMGTKLCIAGGSVSAITAATATAWTGYVGTDYEGMAHSGTCHVRILKAVLNDDGSFPETKWEVQSTACVTDPGSTPDAEPADILLYLLTNGIHGLGFDAGLVNVETGVDGAAASSYRRYTRARGWYLSRVIEQGESIADVIEQLLTATNSTVVWVDGVLTAVPLDDEASATSTYWPGHATYPYTPVTSSTAVGDTDFADREEPVRVERQPRSAVFSTYPVDYTLRHDSAGEITYATNHAEYQSDVWASANGLRRAETLDLTAWVMSEQHAWFVSYLTAQRAMYHRTRYIFRGKQRLSRLAPGDFVTVTDSLLGISSVSCRVETAEEGQGGVIEVTALEWPLGTTKAFTLPTTAPGGRQSDGVARQLAAASLANVPAETVPRSLLTTSQLDKDDLWPNPSSEIAPPSDADATASEWADRVNAGAGAYSGAWVRELTSAAVHGFWVPCSPGAQFYTEAMVKRTAGAGSGGRVGVIFYPTLGSFSGALASHYSSYSSSGSWTKVAVTSDAAPAATNAAYIAYASSGDTVQFDSLYARRVMQPETIASELVTVTPGTGWTVNYSEIRKVGSLVCGTIQLTAGASAAWSSIFTLPIGARPLADVFPLGMVTDFSASIRYPTIFYVDTGGVCQLNYEDDGTSYATSPHAIGTSDIARLTFVLACF